MKSTGMTRPIDQLGRVVIPKELRKQLNWSEEDRVEIFVENDSVIFKKYSPGCYCCNEVDNLTNVLGLNICPKCLVEFKKAAVITDKLRGVKNGRR